MSCTSVLNTDIIWLVLQHAAYNDNFWDYRTLRACCCVSSEWYPLAKKMLFRFIVLRDRQQVRILQQTRGKHLQIGPNAPFGRPGYDVFTPGDIWEAQTRILECHWSHHFCFDDIYHALALFPSLYEVRVILHDFEGPRVHGYDTSWPVPSTIRALRFTGSMILSEKQNITAASRFTDVLPKYTRLTCLQFKNIWIIPYFQFTRTVQINELTFLELDIHQYLDRLSGDRFDNLLYLILHQKSEHAERAIPQHIAGVFKRVKSLTVFYHSHVTSPERVPQLSRLSETFPALTELRLGIRVFRLQMSILALLFSQIPSGVISLSLFISADWYNSPARPTESPPGDTPAIPPNLRYFEYGIEFSAWARTLGLSVIRPLLDACESMGVQLLPTRIYAMTEVVSTPLLF